MKRTDDEGLNGKGAKIIQSPMEKSLIGYCVASREGIFCNVQSHSNDLMGDLARKVKFEDKETALFHFCPANAYVTNFSMHYLFSQVMNNDNSKFIDSVKMW